MLAALGGEHKVAGVPDPVLRGSLLTGPPLEPDQVPPLRKGWFQEPPNLGIAMVAIDPGSCPAKPARKRPSPSGPRLSAEAPLGAKVDAYCNLATGTSSIKALEGDGKGKVIAHPPRLVLRDVVFRINASGLKRAREEQVRNVHAYARGVVVGDDVAAIRDAPNAVRVRYNPYLRDTFFSAVSGEEVHTAAFVAIEDKQAFAILREDQ